MTEPTKERLARALETADCPDLADRARAGEYSDFDSPHATPKVVLVNLLRGRGEHHPARRILAQRIVQGEFDDTREEADTWFTEERRHLL